MSETPMDVSAMDTTTGSASQAEFIKLKDPLDQQHQQDVTDGSIPEGEIVPEQDALDPPPPDRATDGPDNCDQPPWHSATDGPPGPSGSEWTHAPLPLIPDSGDRLDHQHQQHVTDGPFTVGDIVAAQDALDPPPPARAADGPASPTEGEVAPEQQDISELPPRHRDSNEPPTGNAGDIAQEQDHLDHQQQPHPTDGPVHGAEGDVVAEQDAPMEDTEPQPTRADPAADPSPPVEAADPSPEIKPESPLVGTALESPPAGTAAECPPAGPAVAVEAEGLPNVEAESPPMEVFAEGSTAGVEAAGPPMEVQAPSSSMEAEVEGPTAVVEADGPTAEVRELRAEVQRLRIELESVTQELRQTATERSALRGAFDSLTARVRQALGDAEEQVTTSGGTALLAAGVPSVARRNQKAKRDVKAPAGAPQKKRKLRQGVLGAAATSPVPRTPCGDKQLHCEGCAGAFTWTAQAQRAGEAHRHAPPTKCADCRGGERSQPQCRKGGQDQARHEPAMPACLNCGQLGHRVKDCTKPEACRQFKRGKCTRGDCKFSHS